MKAFIFAAGYGTRMQPFNEELAKPAMPFFGRPMIAHTLEWLAANGIDTVIINLHHLPETVRRAVAEHSPPELHVIFSAENEILGTGGGLIHARHHFELDDELLAVNGDIFTDMPLFGLLEQHKQTPCASTLVLNSSPENQALFGVGVQDNGAITDFWGEPANHEACVDHRAFLGVYVVTHQLLNILTSEKPDGGFACVKEHGFIPALSAQIRLQSKLVDAHWFDLGTPKRYLNGHKMMVDQAGQLSGLPQSRPYVWSRDRIPPHVVVKPPAVIGAGLQPGTGCTIGPAAFIGNNVQLRDGTHVRHSVVWDNATLEGNISDCVVSSRARVSALTD